MPKKMPKPRKARQIYDGEPYEIKRWQHFVICCDCGLTHYNEYDRKPSGKLFSTTWRVPKMTAKVRKAKVYKGLKLPKGVIDEHYNGKHK